MDKSTRKEASATRKFNPIVVEQLSTKYGLTKRYIRECLRGDRRAIVADQLKKEYNLLLKEINKVLDTNNSI